MKLKTKILFTLGLAMFSLAALANSSAKNHLHNQHLKSYKHDYGHSKHSNKHKKHNNLSQRHPKSKHAQGFYSPYRQDQRNNRRNTYRHNDYTSYNHGDRYRNYSPRKRTIRPNRHYKRNHNRNYRPQYNYYFESYRPYNYDNRYVYRPLRGLGHYFNRTHYGYGHWHDGMWCETYHPQSYYYDYYSNYPYNDGWRIGDGDFGIWFRF